MQWSDTTASCRLWQDTWVERCLERLWLQLWESPLSHAAARTEMYIIAKMFIIGSSLTLRLSQDALTARKNNMVALGCRGEFQLAFYVEGYLHLFCYAPQIVSYLQAFVPA